MASSAMLKPLPPASIASTLIVVPWKVRFQHVPHAAELKPATAGAPPMKGKLGIWEKFWKPARAASEGQQSFENMQASS